MLKKTPVVAAPETTEAKSFVALLREVAKVFSIRDLVEEYSACQCFPLQEGWTVTSWAPEEKWIEGIPMPDFTASFSIGFDGIFFNLRLCLCLQTLIQRPLRPLLTKLLDPSLMWSTNS